jgi:transcriptional regulator with XRE-family HTH domain
MTLGDRIKQLRQQRGWSQAQLSKKLNVHQKQISGYERGVHSPSIELLVRIAELFNVSLDYIAFDKREEKNIIPIADRELMQAVQQIDQLSAEDKATIKAVLNTFIVKNRFQRLASETQDSTAAN